MVPYAYWLLCLLEEEQGRGEGATAIPGGVVSGHVCPLFHQYGKEEKVPPAPLPGVGPGAGDPVELLHSQGRPPMDVGEVGHGPRLRFLRGFIPGASLCRTARKLDSVTGGVMRPGLDAPRPLVPPIHGALWQSLSLCNGF